MASQLTIIAVTARKGIKFGIFGIIALIILRIVWGFGTTAYRTVVPPKAPPPTLGFGPLPQVIFPDLDIDLPKLNYKVETASGLLPAFPEQMQVYAMPRPTSSFSSYELMINLARAYGFTRNPIKTSGRIYRFNHPRVPSTLEADIITGSFTISFNLAVDPSPLSGRAPTIPVATDIAKDYLDEADKLPEDLNEKVEGLFLRAEAQNLVTARSISEAQLVEISLYRDPILVDETEYPIVTPDPDKANVWFYVSSSSDKSKKIISGEFKYFPVDRSLFHTYTIKTAEQALQELIKGAGYIANLGSNKAGNIVIRQIYLAYYDPRSVSNFLQPVIVFEGDGGFVAYVPAVSSDLVQSLEDSAQ